ncbi:hypothetical protein GOODEAATRI_010691 [Goodea atripinnis]|uniref:Uncharacterized protein n=1 Tax=Goodea atripinnis TaxID=208336 RepID=A0ABV0NJG2_9TELE
MRYGAAFGIFPTIRIKSIEMTRHLPHFHLVLQLYSSQLKPSLSHSLFSAQSVKITLLSSPGCHLRLFTSCTEGPTSVLLCYPGHAAAEHTLNAELYNDCYNVNFQGL